jgi:hypothetical protein
MEYKELILQNIETNHIKAYSKAHFALRMILLVATAILILLVSICLFSYICFNLRTSGRAGIVPFLQFFPWTSLVIDIVLVSMLQWLLRNFRFGYRIPVLHLLLVLLVITGVAGYVVYRETGFNEMLLQEVKQHHLPPPLENLYENIRQPL